MKVPIAYDALISKAVKEIPYEALIRIDRIAWQLAEQFSMSYDEAKTVTNVKLERMAERGEVRQLEAGLYCHLQQTVFGPIAPDVDQIMVRIVTVKDGARIGYESGPALTNRIGLSTLVPRNIEITTNLYDIRLPKGCNVELKRPVAMITDANWMYLQFLDLFEFLPNAHIDAVKPALLVASLIKERELDPLTLISTARKHYPSKTVLRLADLISDADIS